MMHQIERVLLAGLAVLLCVQVPPADTYNTAQTARSEVVVGLSKQLRDSAAVVADQVQPPSASHLQPTEEEAPTTFVSPAFVITIVPKSEEASLMSTTISALGSSIPTPVDSAKSQDSPVQTAEEHSEPASLPATPAPFTESPTSAASVDATSAAAEQLSTSSSTGSVPQNVPAAAGGTPAEPGLSPGNSTTAVDEVERLAPTEAPTTVSVLEESSTTAPVLASESDAVSFEARPFVVVEPDMIISAPASSPSADRHSNENSSTNSGIDSGAVAESNQQNSPVAPISVGPSPPQASAVESGSRGQGDAPERKPGVPQPATHSSVSQTESTANPTSSTAPATVYDGPTAAPVQTAAQLLHLQKSQALLRQAALVARIHQRYTAAVRVFYQKGSSESDLPECSAHQVCNRVDVYATPWVERQCRCPNRASCPQSVDAEDGHSFVDRTRLFKTCEPVESLPTCRYFRDVTWTIEQREVLTSTGETTTSVGRQTVHCICPSNSVAYIARHKAIQEADGSVAGFKYSFACSPQSRLTCSASEPCRLFTVKRRRFVDEVNTNTLCDCGPGRWCPSQHTDASISPGSFFKEDHVKVFTGFCQAIPMNATAEAESVQGNSTTQLSTTSTVATAASNGTGSLRAMVNSLTGQATTEETPAQT